VNNPSELPLVPSTLVLLFALAAVGGVLLAGVFGGVYEKVVFKQFRGRTPTSSRWSSSPWDSRSCSGTSCCSSSGRRTSPTTPSAGSTSTPTSTSPARGRGRDQPARGRRAPDPRRVGVRLASRGCNPPRRRRRRRRRLPLADGRPGLREGPLRQPVDLGRRQRRRHARGGRPARPRRTAGRLRRRRQHARRLQPEVRHHHRRDDRDNALHELRAQANQDRPRDAGDRRRPGARAGPRRRHRPRPARRLGARGRARGHRGRPARLVRLESQPEHGVQPAVARVRCGHRRRHRLPVRGRAGRPPHRHQHGRRCLPAAGRVRHLPHRHRVRHPRGRAALVKPEGLWGDA